MYCEFATKTCRPVSGYSKTPPASLRMWLVSALIRLQLQSPYCGILKICQSNKLQALSTPTHPTVTSIGSLVGKSVPYGSVAVALHRVIRWITEVNEYLPLESVIVAPTVV